MTPDEKQAALINQIGAYLNDCRPPVNATTQQAGQAIMAFNELVKPMVDSINERAKALAKPEPDPVHG